MRSRWPEVRRPSVGRHLRGEPLELAAADVFEVLAQRIRGRFLVEIHGHAKALRDFARRLLRERDAVLHGDAFNRHERDDVDGAKTRMLARVSAQVDRAGSRFEEREHGGLERCRIAGERDHRSVMRGVGGIVEQPRARHAAHRINDPFDNVGSTTLADVGNALDDRHRRQC